MLLFRIGNSDSRRMNRSGCSNQACDINGVVNDDRSAGDFRDGRRIHALIHAGSGRKHHKPRSLRRNRILHLIE